MRQLRDESEFSKSKKNINFKWRLGTAKSSRDFQDDKGVERTRNYISSIKYEHYLENLYYVEDGWFLYRERSHIK